MIKLKDFFSFKHNRFFWLNLIGMVIAVIGCIGGTLFWLDAYTHHGQSYVVPDIKHKSLEQAQLLLQNQQMQGIVVDSTFVKELSPGIVLEQKPEAGMRVKEGRTVYLTINTREVPRVRIPDIIDNSSVRQAAAKLKAMKFKLTEPRARLGIWHQIPRTETEVGRPGAFRSPTHPLHREYPPARLAHDRFAQFPTQPGGKRGASR